jgi:predicted Ser/Thr protein kinase
MRFEDGIFGLYSRLYENQRDIEFSLGDYLGKCSDDPSYYAGAGERMLCAIGEPVMVDTSQDPRVGRIFMNRTIKVYPTFADFFGMEETIEEVVDFLRKAVDELVTSRRVLYLLGPVGGRQGALAERLRQLMENEPIYVLKAGNEISPVFESPLGLFDPVTLGPEFERRFGIPPRRLGGSISPWAVKRLEDFGGSVRGFTVVRVCPWRRQQCHTGQIEDQGLPGKIDISFPGNGIRIGHSNLVEWQAFRSREALGSRFSAINVPVPLWTTEECKRYASLLEANGVRSHGPRRPFVRRMKGTPVMKGLDGPLLRWTRVAAIAGCLAVVPVVWAWVAALLGL